MLNGSDIQFIDNIFEVVIGNDLNGMHYKVGSLHNNGKLRITFIENAQNAYFLMGVRRVNIYATRVDDPEKKEFLWKTSDNQPVLITRNTDEEDKG